MEHSIEVKAVFLRMLYCFTKYIALLQTVVRIPFAAMKLVNIFESNNDK